MFAAFTSGVLLICDAWFDLMTAGPNDVWLSVFTALVIEVPLAIFMITGAQRIMRLTMMRLVADGSRDAAVAAAAVSVTRYRFGSVSSSSSEAS